MTLIPNVLRKRINQYFESQDKILSFLAECCMSDPNAVMEKQAFYNRYRSWCKDGEQRPQGRYEFYEALAKHPAFKEAGGFLTRRRTTNSNAQFVVAGLRFDAFEDLENVSTVSTTESELTRLLTQEKSVNSVH
jgi:phage/plasmid-associated DNA primase